MQKLRLFCLVLPGVHHRLVANQQEVVNLLSFVSKGFESMATQILDAFVSQEEAMREQDCQTGKVYMELAQSLLGEGSSPVRTPPNRSHI
jgi:hypothetical protein